MIDGADRARCATQLPELPEARRQRYRARVRAVGLRRRLLTASRETADYFEATVTALGAPTPKLCANWVTGELAAALNREDVDIARSRVSPDALGCADREQRGRRHSYRQDGEGGVRRDVATARAAPTRSSRSAGLRQISDAGAIEKMVDEVLAANAKQVADYRAGKEKAFNSLVGQVMKATKGKANPAQVNEILRRKLGG